MRRDGADANRFLVGDVKQSIYRFRLADPKIFRDYAKSWRGENGQTIPLAENFRSREALAEFRELPFQRSLMREEIGGVNYDDEAKLKFGSPETRADFSTGKRSVAARGIASAPQSTAATKIPRRKRRAGRTWTKRTRKRGWSRCV